MHIQICSPAFYQPRTSARILHPVNNPTSLPQDIFTVLHSTLLGLAKPTGISYIFILWLLPHFRQNQFTYFFKINLCIETFCIDIQNVMGGSKQVLDTCIFAPVSKGKTRNIQKSHLELFLQNPFHTQRHWWSSFHNCQINCNAGPNIIALWYNSHQSVTLCCAREGRYIHTSACASIEQAQLLSDIRYK